MGQKAINIETLHLEESDFTDLKAFKQTNFIFLLICFIVHLIIPIFMLYIFLDFYFRAILSIIAPCISFSYLVFMLRPRIDDFIFSRRLKLSLKHLKKIKISYDPRWQIIKENPAKPPPLTSKVIIYQFLFIFEVIILFIGTFVFNEFIPNPDNNQFLMYSIGFTIICLIFTSIGIVQGIWRWNRSFNYYGSSFYYLKTILLEKDKKITFELLSEALSFYCGLIKENYIDIDCNFNNIEELGITLRFFTPDNEVIGTILFNQLTEVLIALKNRKWLEALKKIEQIESSLDQTLSELDCKRLTTGKSEKNHEDSFIESIKKNFYKNFIDALLKYLLVPILSAIGALIITMILGT